MIRFNKKAAATGDAEGRLNAAAKETEEKSGGNVQMSLLSAGQNPVINSLKALDIDTLTPIEAMNALYELKKQAESL